MNGKGEAEYVVAIMGPTGSGKTTFVKTVTQRQDIEIGHQLQSATDEVKPYKFSHDGKLFVLVDTPGFDDTYVSDAEVLRRILRWLQSSYRKGKKLHGIIYLHRLEDPRMQGSMLRNLRMFRDLCGQEDMSGVVLGATFWERLDTSERTRKLAELTETPDFWGSLIKRGARSMLLRPDRASNLSLLDSLAARSGEMPFAEEKIAKSWLLKITLIGRMVDTYDNLTARHKMNKMAKEHVNKMNVEITLSLAQQNEAAARARADRQSLQQKLDQQLSEREAAETARNRQAQENFAREQDEIQKRVQEQKDRWDELKSLHAQRLDSMKQQQQKDEMQAAIRRKRAEDAMSTFYTNWTCTRGALKQVQCDGCQQSVTGRFYHCCFCLEDDFDLCPGCWASKASGTDCKDRKHPAMKCMQTEGCTIM